MWIAVKNLFVLCVCVSTWQQAQGAIITFDGGINGQEVSSFYRDDGILFTVQPIPGAHTAWRFHDATVDGNVSFPFIDDWGIVVNQSINTDDDPVNIPSGSLRAYFEFLAPVDFLAVDAVLQSADFPGAWSLKAFDSSGTLIDSETAEFASAGPGFLTSTLRVNGVSSIHRVLVVTNRKLGVDTLEFAPDYTGDGNGGVIPEPSTIAIRSLLIAIGFGYGWRKRKAA